ncbi:MAG TPA: PAS domain-containing protein [Kofleriaceae bacterium]|nr:PAS domain-containing protein [Kofleriaceae bacterium]
MIRAATLPSLVGQRMIGRLAFDAANGTRVVDPYLERDGAPAVAYAAAARSPDGAVTGAVVLWVDAEALWEVARGLDGAAGEGSFAMIVDRLGILIAHTFNRDLVFHPAGRLSDAVVDELVADARFGPPTRELLEDVRPAPQRFVRTDLASRTIVECNQTLCDRLGYTRSELLGQPSQIVYFDDDVTDISDRLVALVQRGEFSDVERRLRRKDGGHLGQPDQSRPGPPAPDRARRRLWPPRWIRYRQRELDGAPARDDAVRAAVGDARGDARPGGVLSADLLGARLIALDRRVIGARAGGSRGRS